MSADRLTPTEDLFMEVLSARIRLGEPWWTFAANRANRLAAKSLEAKGLITTMSGLVERTFRADLTDEAKGEWLHEGYTPPLARSHRATKEMLSHCEGLNSDLLSENVKLHTAVSMVQEYATAWAGQPTDYDEDTEQQIRDGHAVLLLLGGQCPGCNNCKSWRPEYASTEIVTNVLGTPTSRRGADMRAQP